MNKRVAIFISNLNGGGVKRVYLNLANGLVRQGLQVDLVVGRMGVNNIQQIPQQVRVFDLNKSRSLFTIRGLVAYLKSVQPDVLLTAQTHINLIGIIAKIISRKKTRLVLSEHIDLREVIKHNPKEKLIVRLASFLYRSADEMVAVSSGVAESMVSSLKIDRDRIKMIPNPLIGDDLSRLKNEKNDHPWLNQVDVPIAIAVGRLVPQKDFETLINAVSEARRLLDIKLIILGEGFLRDKLKKKIDELSLCDHIQLAGNVENPFKYLSRAKVFVLSSLYEGFPSVLVEAMACGIPVVSTDCPSGPREILEDGKIGRLVPVGDVSALGQAIIATIKNPYSVEASQKRAMEFNITNCTKKYLQVLLPFYEVSE